MFQRIYSYDIIRDSAGRVFRPRAYGRMEADLMWSGWLVFFPSDETTAVATPFETTENSADALTAWAVGISRGYLESALVRALQLETAPLLATEIRSLERLERAGSVAVDTAIRHDPHPAQELDGPSRAPTEGRAHSSQGSAVANTTPRKAGARKGSKGNQRARRRKKP